MFQAVAHKGINLTSRTMATQTQESHGFLPAKAPRSLDTKETARSYDKHSTVQASLEKDVSQLMGLAPGMHVLDVGCGSGRFAMNAAEVVHPGSVSAIDLSEERIQVARSKLAEKKASLDINVEFTAGDGNRLPDYYPQRAYFEKVAMHSFFHWLTEREKTLVDSFNLLKPGGDIFITTVDRDNLPGHEKLRIEVLEELQFESDDEGKYYNGPEMRRALEGAGFINVTVDTVDMFAVKKDPDEVMSWIMDSSSNSYLAYLPNDKKDKAIETIKERLWTFRSDEENGKLKIPVSVILVRGQRPA